MLSSVGLTPYCIRQAENLQIGLKWEPELAILDLYMNNETKIDQIFKEIKNNYKFFEIPVIFVSASEKREDIVSVLEIGANDYIKKPFFFEELLARIGVQFRIIYMNEENKKFLNTQEKLSQNLLNLLEEVRMQKEQIQRMNRLLKQKSITDPLTKVYNRGYFFNILKREIARVNRYREDLSLIMIDIDHFKNINDTYGHLIGDEVLKGMVNVCKKRIRTSDLMARYGGEEFVILLTNTSSENAYQVAEDVRKSVEKILFKTRSGEKFKVTVSAGITSYISAEDINDFFARLDDNLYEAKSNGRNRSILK